MSFAASLLPTLPSVFSSYRTNKYVLMHHQRAIIDGRFPHIFSLALLNTVAHSATVASPKGPLPSFLIAGFLGLYSGKYLAVMGALFLFVCNL